MVGFSAFSRSLVVLAFCSAAVAVSSSPASARSHHSETRYAHGRDESHLERRHFHHFMSFARGSRSGRGVARPHSRGFEKMQAGVVSRGVAMSGGRAGSGIIREARRYLGGNPTTRSNLWCARFMKLVLERTGHRGTGSDLAASFAHYGHHVSGPRVGAIAVMSRRGGGHVGIITGVDGHGNLTMISGNSGNRVREAPCRAAASTPM